MPGVRSSLYTIDHRHRGFSEQVVQYRRPGPGLGAAQTTAVQPVPTSLKLQISPTLYTTTMPKIPLLGFGPTGGTDASDAGSEAVEEAVQSTTEVLEPGGGIYPDFHPMQMPSVSADTVDAIIGRTEADAAALEADLRATNPWVLAFAGIAGATLGFALLRLAR